MREIKNLSIKDIKALLDYAEETAENIRRNSDWIMEEKEAQTFNLCIRFIEKADSYLLKYMRDLSRNVEY